MSILSLSAPRATRNELRQRRAPAEQLERRDEPQAARPMASGAARPAASPAPSIMTARSASFSAVSGSARMTGCTTSGKRADEKNTPEQDAHRQHHQVHQAADRLGVLRARGDEQAEAGEGERAEHGERRRAAASEPRIGTPKTSAAKPSRMRQLDRAGTARASARTTSRKSRAAHRRGDEALEQLARAHLDDREADAPQAARHQVHAEQARDEEVDVARAGLGHARVVRPAVGIDAARGALQGVVDDAARADAALGARRVEAVGARRAPGATTTSATLPVRSACARRCRRRAHETCTSRLLAERAPARSSAPRARLDRDPDRLGRLVAEGDAERDASRTGSRRPRTRLGSR